MSDDVLSKVKQESIYPDDLMAEIAQTRLGKPLIISTILHIAFLLVTSVGFIGLCAKYHTLEPRAAVEAEKKAAKEQEKAAAVEAAKTEKKGPVKPAAQGDAPAPADGTAAPADSTDNTNGGTGKSPIEQTLEEKNTDYPAKSNVGFGTVDSLDE